MDFHNATVLIVQGRWDVTILIIDEQGQEHKFIASADAALTYHDGIWFSTDAEYRAALDEL